MDNKLNYQPDLDYLNDKELNLLQKACEAVTQFVSKSKIINRVGYKTRDAHVTSYSSIKGTFLLYDNFEEHTIFPEHNLDCIIRISNAHMKLVSQKRTIPAYGFSVKFFHSGKTILNLPVVNFPLFPINSVTHFLNIFISANLFFSGNIIQKLLNAFKILKNIIAVLPGFFHYSFIRQALKLFAKRKHFILSFDYHSIGAYQLGNHIVKYKLVPIAVPTTTSIERIDRAIENFVTDNNYSLELMIQYCYNLKDQPVNKLNRMWKRSKFIPIGKIQISDLVEKTDCDIEAMSFNPFESSIGLQPAGRIQRLRNEAYKASHKFRNNEV